MKIKFNNIYIVTTGIIICILLVAGLAYLKHNNFNSVKKKINTISAEKSISDAKKAVRDGKKNEAIKLYKDAIKSDPKNNVIKDDLAMLYYQTGEYNKANQIWSNSLQKNPNNSFNLNALANSYRDQGNNKEAIEYYLKAINIGNLDSIGNLITLYNSEDKFTDSITLLNSLIKKYPEDENLKKLLASTYNKSGNLKKANEILSNSE